MTTSKEPQVITSTIMVDISKFEEKYISSKTAMFIKKYWLQSHTEDTIMIVTIM